MEAGIGPQNVRAVKNYDPILGGYQFSTPRLAPCSTFSRACQRTPNGEIGRWIIPWDHQNRDFVYAAIDDTVYRGYMTGYDLKTVRNFPWFLILTIFVGSRHALIPSKLYYHCWIFMLLCLGVHALHDRWYFHDASLLHIMESFSLLLVKGWILVALCASSDCFLLFINSGMLSHEM